MPPITALLHTKNDDLRLGRTLETLLPCTEILIVDHGSIDATRRIGREHGARIVDATSDSTTHPYLDLVHNDWIFCIDPRESITESLQVSLFEWSAIPTQSGANASAFSMRLRHQVGDVWTVSLTPEVRLVPRSWSLWHEHLPSNHLQANHPSAVPLEGELLRFDYP
jgi:glycosyltransferase involved in cell wall biosynthesis